MPSFTESLERALHHALTFANDRDQEYATLEHLLLALCDDDDAVSVLTACNVKIPKLRQDLEEYIETELANLVSENGEDSQPTAGFQRVIQRAVIHVQSSGREEVSGANVLVAIFAERESHAAYFLQEQDMTRYDAVNYISHGIAKRHMWIRANGSLPDDPLVHQSMLAYTTDYGFLETALMPHGISLMKPGLTIASLDHAIWFHRPFRLDDWLLYVADSPSASGARGFVRGQIFDRDGNLVASTAQEGLIRYAGDTDE